MCRTDKFGFPSRYVPRFKFVKGFQTGDIVKAVVTSGKKIGTYTGRVAIRSSGSFNVSSAEGLIQGINHKYCFSLHQKDGTMDFKSIDGTRLVSHVPFPRAGESHARFQSPMRFL